MKINIDDIPETGLSVDLKEDADKFTARAGGLSIELKAPVESSLFFLRSGKKSVVVRGDVRTRFGLKCSRCLKDFSHGVDTHFEVFYDMGREEDREKELTAADMDVNYIEGPELDTDEILLSQISLEEPTKPLCSDGCRGLCPSCGADLNKGACACSREEKSDPRFAKLKDFKVK